MTDTTQAPINGNFPAQHAYPDSYNPAAMNAAANFQPAYSSTPSNAPATDQKNGIAKDEVGWYFVEQYYTSMSRCPDKLHLFYSRRSQFVFGTEAESVPVAVGQKVSQCLICRLPCFKKGNPSANSFIRPSMTRSSSWTFRSARSAS